MIAQPVDTCIARRILFYKQEARWHSWSKKTSVGMKSNVQFELLLCATLILGWCRVTAVAQIQWQPTLQKGKDGVCLSENNRELLHTQIKEVIKNRIVPQLLGLYKHSPANSCADISQGHPSGNYWLNVGNEPQQIYCSLNENRCCNDSDGKWMRIAFLNMSDPSMQCPDGWREVPSPIRTCRRKANTNVVSVNYSSYGVPYSRVCGRIIAYQYGTPEGFNGYINQGQTTIEDAYVDGISITYGQNPRNHIWTLAAQRGVSTNTACPCTCPPDRQIPPFVNGDYFCERGGSGTCKSCFINNNPLWDGHGCTNTGSSTCRDLNNPPWFCKQLPQPTTEDIEVRLIGYVTRQNILENEDTPVQLIEIFVQ